jgi:hypothetical protein
MAKAAGSDNRYLTNFSTGLLVGLQKAGRDSQVVQITRNGHTPYGTKHLYAGTVPPAVVAERRKKARIGRKQNLRNRRGF